MRCIQLKAKSLSLILVALILWHHEAVWMFGRTRAIERQKQALSGIEGNRFDSLLSQLKEVVKQSETKTKTAPENGFAGISSLTALKESLVKENYKIQEQFEQLEKSLNQKGLSDEILNRHEQFVRGV